MRKVVLDTNVLISGVIASGYSASILDAARREEIKLVTSTQLLEEFSDVISRRHMYHLNKSGDEQGIIERFPR